MAVTKDSKKVSKGSLGGTVVFFHPRTARITTRKQAAFAANTRLAPINGTKAPPKAGPTIPAMLSCKPPKVTAEGSSVSRTIWGTIELQAGALKAKPAPTRKTQDSTT